MIRLFKGLLQKAMKQVSHLTSRLSVPNFGEAPQDTAIFDARRLEMGIRIENECAGRTINDKPYFLFNPRAYELEGTFVKSAEICDACDQPCVWEYDSCIFGAFDDFTMCARCISEGRISDAVNGKDFHLQSADAFKLSSALYAELQQRTPGFATFNEFDWPILNDMPLAFVGYGEEPYIMQNMKAQQAIAAACAKSGDEHKLGSPHHYVLLFKEVDGETYVVEFNWD